MLPDGTRQFNSTPEYCHQAIERSLQRLGLPSVDLYYCHRVDGKTPIEKTVEAMVQKKNDGKLKYLGLSECSADTLRRAHKVHPITAVQINTHHSRWILRIRKSTCWVLALLHTHLSDAVWSLALSRAAQVSFEAAGTGCISPVMQLA